MMILGSRICLLDGLFGGRCADRAPAHKALPLRHAVKLNERKPLAANSAHSASQAICLPVRRTAHSHHSDSVNWPALFGAEQIQSQFV